MAVRFHCENCSYQILLDAPPPDGVSCPSCRVALLPLAEVAGIQIPPSAPVQTAPNLVPKIAPWKPPTQPRPRSNPALRYAAITGAVVFALLLVTVAFAWTAYSKHRQRSAMVVVIEPSDSTQIPDDLPPDDAPPSPPDEERRPRLVGPPVEVLPKKADTVREKPEPPVVEQPPVAEQPPMKPERKETQPAKPVREFRRRDKSTEDDLGKQLRLAPEVALDHVPFSGARMQTLAQRMAKSSTPFQGPAMLVAQRPDLQGLPMRMGVDCQVGKESAENLQVLSRKMRVVLESTISKNPQIPDPRPDADKLRAALLDDQKKEWLRPEAVPCLLQLLQAENSPVRKVMVEALGQIKDRRATEALAMRAMMDLNPEVRELAARELLERPREDYEALLLAGLRYPWSPVAIHAAETLAFVNDQNALPQLVKMLDQPDPALPFTARQGTKETVVVREVVRINHLGNCLLCHPPSFTTTDLVRGAVPTPGQPLPAPATTPQYYDNGSIFVHADTTYLKQDFSVMQPVEQPNQWPVYQRFDYMVRVRRPALFEMDKLRNRDQQLTGSHEAVLFALRELTGKNLGPTAKDWKLVVGPKTETVKFEEHVGADWKQFAVSASSEPDPWSEKDAQELKSKLLAAPKAKQEAILAQLHEAKGLPYTDALVEAIGQLDGSIQSRARELLVQRLERMTDTTLRERLHEDDAEMRRAAALAVKYKKSKTLIPELLPLLSDQHLAVIQAARQALKTLTNEDFGPSPEAPRPEREKAAEDWKTWWKTQTGA